MQVIYSQRMTLSLTMSSCCKGLDDMMIIVMPLKPHAVEQFDKVKVLNELFRLKKMRGFNLTVRIDNDLHGKVYIGKSEGKYVGCIISSANFTNNGLEHNHDLYQLRFLERWYKKSVPQLIELKRPDAAFAVAVELCRQLPDFIFRRDIEEYLKPKKTRLRKLIEGAFSALVESVKAWNNNEKRRWVNDFIFKQTKYYHDFRGLQKVMLQMRLSESFVGEPVEVVREKSEEEYFWLMMND